MTNYLVKTGHDVALVSLDIMMPQPRSTGVQAVRRTYGGDGSVYEEGAFIELEFDALESPTEYTTLLTQFGLNAALKAAVTVYVPNAFLAFTRYNGTAVRPEVGKDMRRENYFIRSVTILVRDLETAA